MQIFDSLYLVHLVVDMELDTPRYTDNPLSIMCKTEGSSNEGKIMWFWYIHWGRKFALETIVEAGDRASRRPTTFISHMCGTSAGEKVEGGGRSVHSK